MDSNKASLSICISLKNLEIPINYIKQQEQSNLTNSKRQLITKEVYVSHRDAQVEKNCVHRVTECPKACTLARSGDGSDVIFAFLKTV